MSKKRLRGGARHHQSGPPSKRQSQSAMRSTQQKQQQQQQRQRQNNKTKKQQQQQQQQQHVQRQPTQPTLPFAPDEHILLVGEGDLSFAASLVAHHGCAHVTASVPERSLDELAAKYADAARANAAAVEAADGCRVLYGVDVMRMTPFLASGRGRTRRRRRPQQDPGGRVEGTKADGSEDGDDGRVFNGFSDGDEEGGTRGRRNEDDNNNKEEEEGAFHRILFNFPHVGGRTTDVNRQVRHNQELLVAFFRRAAPSLRRGGTIVVTLFEAEPYTLWNVRDLARHAGLQVVRSFRFRAAAYPGYSHARTLGRVARRGGKGHGGRASESKREGEGEEEGEGGGEEEEGAEGEGEGESEGGERSKFSETAWKGEERAARSYVFVRKGEAPRAGGGEEEGPGRGKRKRRDGGESDDSDDDGSFSDD